MVDKQACVLPSLNPGREKEWRPFPSEEGRTEKRLFHMLAHAGNASVYRAPWEADRSCQLSEVKRGPFLCPHDLA